MKETTGDLNATVVIVLAIGILMAFFYYTVWPIIKSNFTSNSQCSKAICEPCNMVDSHGRKNCATVQCHEKGSSEIFECVYKG